MIGPLFTVLSGQQTTLPYRLNIKDKDSPQYVILPESKPSAEPYEFAPGPHWRLIATINSIDKAALYQMSYALSRRFGWVYVDAPRDAAGFIEAFLSPDYSPGGMIWFTLHDSFSSDAWRGEDEPWVDGGGRVVTEEFSDLVEADAEPGLCEVSVRLAGGGLWPDEQVGDPRGPGEGEGDKAEEQGELARCDEAGVLGIL